MIPLQNHLAIQDEYSSTQKSKSRAHSKMDSQIIGQEHKPNTSIIVTTDNERKSSYTQRIDDHNKSVYYSGHHNSSI